MIVVFMLSKPNKFKKFKIPRRRYKKQKEKKKAIPNSSAFPNDQTDNFLNLWFVFITSEFWLFSRLIWVNFSTKTTSPADPILLTLCPSHKIGMCTLLFCATLSISFSLMLGFWLRIILHLGLDKPPSPPFPSSLVTSFHLSLFDLFYERSSHYWCITSFFVSILKLNLYPIRVLNIQISLN